MNSPGIPDGWMVTPAALRQMADECDERARRVEAQAGSVRADDPGNPLAMHLASLAVHERAIALMLNSTAAQQEYL